MPIAAPELNADVMLLPLAARKMLCYTAISLMIVDIHQGVDGTQQSSQPCPASEYVNQNQIDPPTLSVREISGRVIDPNDVAIASACVSLFSESDHRLLRTTIADKEGRFRLREVRQGHYRLLVYVAGFCTANVRLRIVSWPAGGAYKSRKLVIHMDARGVDRCSYVDYK
jgi:hypothetical protein